MPRRVVMTINGMQIRSAVYWETGDAIRCTMSRYPFLPLEPSSGCRSLWALHRMSSTTGVPVPVNALTMSRDPFCDVEYHPSLTWISSPLLDQEAYCRTTQGTTSSFLLLDGTTTAVRFRSEACSEASEIYRREPIDDSEENGCLALTLRLQIYTKKHKAPVSLLNAFKGRPYHISISQRAY
jgi:hypothetical protein